MADFQILESAINYFNSKSFIGQQYKQIKKSGITMLEKPLTRAEGIALNIKGNDYIITQDEAMGMLSSYFNNMNQTKSLSLKNISVKKRSLF